jgi:hypothetical protein
MKSAALFLRPSTSQNPKAPNWYGTQFVPASLVMELYAMLQAGQYDPQDSDQQTGEPRFKVKVSVWRQDGSKGYVMSGNLEAPSEEAAYQANKGQQQPPAGGGWGAPPPQSPPQQQPPAWGGQPQQPPGYPQQQPPQGPPLGYGQPAPQQQPPAWGGQPPQAPPAPQPQQPAPGGWGQPAPGGWG